MTVAARSMLEEIGHRERGILLALLLLKADDALFERLDGAQREVCARSWHILQETDSATRSTILADWSEQAQIALPCGLESLHPSWVMEAFAHEPEDLVWAVMPALPKWLCRRLEDFFASRPVSFRQDLGVFLQERQCQVVRLMFGWLSPLCESPCGPLAEELCCLDFDGLLAEVMQRGARTLGHSLAGSSPQVRARAMAFVGECWAQTVRDASAEKLSRQARREAVAQAETSLASLAGTASDRLLHIGLATLKSDLLAEGPGSLWRVAGRLPAELGRPWIGWQDCADARFVHLFWHY